MVGIGTRNDRPRWGRARQLRVEESTRSTATESNPALVSSSRDGRSAQPGCTHTLAWVGVFAGILFNVAPIFIAGKAVDGPS